jgi:hypothetical protein
MTWQSMCNIIRARFKTQVADVLKLPTQYDNQDYNNPDNRLWCRVSIRQGESNQVSAGGTGGNRHRTAGVMIVQIFGPTGKGDRDHLVVADAIKTAFRAVSDTDVKFRDPSVSFSGRVESEWQVNVTCPFYADDIG